MMSTVESCGHCGYPMRLVAGVIELAEMVRDLARLVEQGRAS